MANESQTKVDDRILVTADHAPLEHEEWLKDLESKRAPKMTTKPAAPVAEPVKK